MLFIFVSFKQWNVVIMTLFIFVSISCIGDVYFVVISNQA